MDNEKAVFITDQYGAKDLHDHLGSIGKFIYTSNNVVTGDDGIPRKNSKEKEIWVMTLTDPEKIQRARSYPGFGRTFKEVDSEPVFNSMSKLKTLNDPNSSKYQSDTKQLNEEKDLMRRKAQRYGSLFSQICKAGGEYLKDADPVLIQEFEGLKQELEITDEKD